MHICEFCNTTFEPRPQTKKPRACNNDKCQKKRQAVNEKEWRCKHQDLSSPRYHQIRRKQRQDKIDLILNVLIRCFSIGKEFLDIPLLIQDFSNILAKLLSRLGIRSINKFWSIDLINNFDGLDLSFISNNLQTSSSP